MNVNGINYIVSGVAVSSCFWCPWGGSDHCYEITCKVENKKAPSHPHKNPPEWCPLRRGPISVCLVKNPEADEDEAKSRAWTEEQRKMLEGSKAK